MGGSGRGGMIIPRGFIGLAAAKTAAPRRKAPGDGFLSTVDSAELRERREEEWDLGQAQAQAQAQEQEQEQDHC